MIILFAPSEGKRKGGECPPLQHDSFLFPQMYQKRMEIVAQYEAVIAEGEPEKLCELFGVKDPKEYERYRLPFLKAPTMRAIERYDGVAYDYLDFPSLSSDAQSYIERHVILFSNLFGPIGAGDCIPDYKVKQGSKIGSCVPEKEYKKDFSSVLDEKIAGEEILDLRAGFYDKFYTPASRVTTLKFLKEGKVVSHWAKAYRGIVLREAASARIKGIDELLAMNIESLVLEKIIETKTKKEIVYNVC